MVNASSTHTAGIVGIGGYLPEIVVTNHMLAERLDTSHEWILSRTGIQERRIADAAQSTADLAIEAGLRTLRSAGKRSIDALVLATTTPDHRCPATAPVVASQLGLGQIPAFDVSAVCSGFIYALSVAAAFVNAGQFENVLVIAAEKFSSLIDQEDRNTACLFGDGAGAVVVSRVARGQPGEILASKLKSDGALEGLIKIKAGGCKHPFMPGVEHPRADHFLTMQGQEVFTAAATSMTSSVIEILDTVGWTRQDVDWLVGHQANRRILNMVCKSLELPAEKACIHLDEVGNTAGASIPLALAAKGKQFGRGDRMVLTSFGAGATWGAVAMTWPDIDIFEFN
jgi:3-oxoacyl-[acyl-carrier-protein] synthase-3